MAKGFVQTEKSMTKRYCQYLKLNPETVDQYKYWHSKKHIWKEIPQGIKEVGILNMEIYIHESHAFMIIETPIDFDFEKSFEKLSTLERQAEWEEFVAQFQQVEPGKRSDEKWILMDRAFSLNEAL